MKRKRLRVVALMHPSTVPPDNPDDYSERQAYEWKTEFDVMKTLEKLGHKVRVVAVRDELAPIREMIEEWKPDVVFNLLEEFLGQQEFDHHVVSYLELLQVAYTGCNPRGMVLSRDKALSKKLLAYHHMVVPKFAVFERGRRVYRPKGLDFPLIVKSLTHEASLGISQASIVENDDKLRERVTFIHQRNGTDAIAEQYIAGREFYAGVIGNRRLQVLPIWELVFENLAPGAAPIATASVKHDPEYQRRRGIYQQHAEDLPEELRQHIEDEQADRPHARSRRLHAHRLPSRARRKALLPRSQPEPRHRPQRGICVGSRGDGHRISGADSEGARSGAAPRRRPIVVMVSGLEKQPFFQ